MPSPAPTHRRTPPRAPDTRTAAYDRVRLVSNWVFAGAAAAAAVIAGVVAHQLPGHAGPATSSGPATTGGTGTPADTATSGAPGAPGGSGGPGGSSQAPQAPPQSPGTAGTGGSPLRPPPTTPAPTRRPPVAVSGGTGW